MTVFFFPLIFCICASAFYVGGLECCIQVIKADDDDEIQKLEVKVVKHSVH